MGRQFNDVSSPAGSPMGRTSYGRPQDAEGKIRCFKVKLIDGYDDGFAYWGSGVNLYCARDDGHQYRAFIRASNRDEAMRKLGLLEDEKND